MPVLLGRRTLGGWLPSGPAGNYLVHPEQHQRPEHDLLRAKQDQAASQLFFDGLELAEPGLVRITQWRSGPGLGPAGAAALWAGLARKRG